MDHSFVGLRRSRVAITALVTTVSVLAIWETAGYMRPPSASTENGASILVPGVIGDSLCDAQRILRTTGLTVVKVTGRSSDLIEFPATVVAQIPSAEERYRDPEPILLEVTATDAVNAPEAGSLLQKVDSRPTIATLLADSGLANAAVLSTGTPIELHSYRSGACEPVFATTYHTNKGRVMLLQTRGQILPQGRDIRLEHEIGQRVGSSLYWSDRSYVIGLSPANEKLSKAVRWIKLNPNPSASPH